MRKDTDVERHYTRGNLAEVLFDALTEAGKDLDNLKFDDLAPFDEFHLRGREATLELSEALSPGRESHVLDIGSGLGGPSRHLASLWGCRVTGIDLTEEYCAVAQLLAQKVGLDGKVRYRHASALDMPFENESFDHAYTQHVAMNIEDKPELYGEAFRVLRPGGRFVIYDILQGPGGEVVYPVPWAKTPATSFLALPEEMPGLLADAGFVVDERRDRTGEGRDWFLAMREKTAREGPPKLGLHLLMGPVFNEMAANIATNLSEERVRVMLLVCHKPAL